MNDKFNYKRLNELKEEGRLFDVVKVGYCARLEQETLQNIDTDFCFHNSHGDEGKVNETRMKKEDTEDVELFKYLLNNK